MLCFLGSTIIIHEIIGLCLKGCIWPELWNTGLCTQVTLIYLQLLIKTHHTEDMPSFYVVICFPCAKWAWVFIHVQPLLFHRTVESSLSQSWREVWLLVAARLVKARLNGLCQSRVVPAGICQVHIFLCWFCQVTES